MGEIVSPKVSDKGYQPVLSMVLAIVLTIAALLLGWLLMSITTNRTTQVSRQGISAMAPEGWMVGYGIQDEEMLFWTGDQLAPDHRYTVSKLPFMTGGVLTDSVVVHNLDRGQNLNGYQVVAQAPTRVHDQDAYRVDFAYIKPGGPGNLPKVIQGVDYYLLYGDQVLIVSLEDNVNSFAQSLPLFEDFLNTVRLSAGG
jgi:hypothetical protein